MAQYGHIWPKKVIFGGFWGPQMPFFGGKKGPNSPPQMRSTMFNHVQPMFSPFGVAGTAYCPIWPFMAKKGNFWGVLGPPNAIFWGQKGSKLTPPDVKYNVQPCSTNVQPIWGRWDCLWPNMAILGQKSHKIAIKYGLWRPPRFKKGPSTFHYPNLAHRHLIEHS